MLASLFNITDIILRKFHVGEMIDAEGDGSLSLPPSLSFSLCILIVFTLFIIILLFIANPYYMESINQESINTTGNYLSPYGHVQYCTTFVTAIGTAE